MCLSPLALELIIPLPAFCMCTEVQQPAGKLAFLTSYTWASIPASPAPACPTWKLSKWKQEACEDALITPTHKLALKATSEAWRENWLLHCYRNNIVLTQNMCFSFFFFLLPPGSASGPLGYKTFHHTSPSEPEENPARSSPALSRREGSYSILKSPFSDSSLPKSKNVRDISNVNGCLFLLYGALKQCHLC